MLSSILPLDPDTTVDKVGESTQVQVVIGVDVDTQKDFIDPDGSLYVPADPEVRTNIARLTNGLRRKIGSVDSHAYDAWEFSENGGPFPAHCVKGSLGWLKISESKASRARFIPMSQGNLAIGESVNGQGNRAYGPEEFALEVQDGVQAIFEKEVYSMFANPNAESFIAELVSQISKEFNVAKDQILFAVYGYCTGGYCVDAAAQGLVSQGYNTAIVLDATAPLNIAHNGYEQDGKSVTRSIASQAGIQIVSTDFILTL